MNLHIHIYIVAVIALHNFYVDTHNVNLRTKAQSCDWPWGMGFFEGYSRDIHSKLLLYQVRMFWQNKCCTVYYVV